MIYKKKVKEGYQERIGVLRSVYHDSDTIIEHALRKYPRNMVAKDDILDALVAAVTAYEGSRGGFCLLPNRPESDSHGLPMEMVYYIRRLC